MQEKITKMEILEALNIFSTKMEKRINELEQNLEQKIHDFRVDVNQKFIEIDQRLNYIEAWLNSIERTIVTKSDFNILANSFNGLVDVLKDKEVITVRESTRLLYPKVVN